MFITVLEYTYILLLMRRVSKRIHNSNNRKNLKVATVNGNAAASHAAIRSRKESSASEATVPQAELRYSLRTSAKYGTEKIVLYHNQHLDLQVHKFKILCLFISPFRSSSITPVGEVVIGSPTVINDSIGGSLKNLKHFSPYKEEKELRRLRQRLFLTKLAEWAEPAKVRLAAVWSAVRAAALYSPDEVSLQIFNANIDYAFVWIMVGMFVLFNIVYWAYYIFGRERFL